MTTCLLGHRSLLSLFSSCQKLCFPVFSRLFYFFTEYYCTDSIYLHVLTFLVLVRATRHAIPQARQEYSKGQTAISFGQTATLISCVCFTKCRQFFILGLPFQFPVKYCGRVCFSIVLLLRKVRLLYYSDCLSRLRLTVSHSASEPLYAKRQQAPLYVAVSTETAVLYVYQCKVFDAIIGTKI